MYLRDLCSLTGKFRYRVVRYFDLGCGGTYVYLVIWVVVVHMCTVVGGKF